MATIDVDPARSAEKATQTGEDAAQSREPAPIDFERAVLKEYEATPPSPTRLTGNVLMDSINRALDALFFGGEPAEGTAATARMKDAQHATERIAERDCEGGTDHMAFLRDLCLCPVVERSFAPLPTATPVGRFHESDPFTREVLSHLSKDEPETYLPYIHFHQALPAHYTYLRAEGPPQVPGWASGQLGNAK